MNKQITKECVQCGEEINPEEDEIARWVQDEGWLCSHCVCQEAEARVEREVAEAEKRAYEESEYCLS